MCKKIITYLGLAFSTVAIIVMFATATSYLQLAVASVSYPIFIYFVFRLFPYKNPKAHHLKPLAPLIQPVTLSKGKGSIADIDKRDFLKLIGTVGISFFLFSLFSKKKQIPFIGQIAGEKTPLLPRPSGNQIGAGLTDDYQITEIDEAAMAYYGFTNPKGGWYIMKEDSDTGSFRYSQGKCDFSKSWTNREKLKYDYFYKTF